MAFLKTVGSAAKSAAGKAGKTLKISWIQSKVRAENHVIQDCKAQLGEYYWGLYASGVVFEGEPRALCEKIAAANVQIARHQEKIAALQVQKEPAPAPEESGRQNENEETDESVCPPDGEKD